MESILVVLPLLVFIALLWFTYVNISFGVTIFKSKKEDQSLESGLSTKGKYFYIGLLIFYIGSLIICTYSLLSGMLSGADINTYTFYLNIMTIISVLSTFLLQQIIYVGHRQLLIGKVRFDYRKIKRVSFPKTTKLSFTYGQKQYQTSLRFIDDFKIKKALQKTR